MLVLSDIFYFGVRDRFFVFVSNFYRLPQLKMLDVSNNLLVSIPEEIGSAASLVKYALFYVHFLP